MDVTSEAANFQLVDFYAFLRPIYQLLPYWVLPSKKKLRDLQKLEERVFMQLLDKAKEKIESGNACPSSSTPMRTMVRSAKCDYRFHWRYAARQGCRQTERPPDSP
jgi:hypothetical protein